MAKVRQPQSAINGDSPELPGGYALEEDEGEAETDDAMSLAATVQVGVPEVVDAGRPAEGRRNSFRGDLDSSLPNPVARAGDAAALAAKFDRSKAQRGGAHDRMKGSKSGRGEPRYPVVDIEPSSPRISLPDKRLKSWQDRVKSGGGKVRSGQEADHYEPCLEWYAEQLLSSCRALVPASAKIVALQARHNSGLAQLEEGQQLWHLLSEVSMLFSACDYHTARAAEVLSREATAQLTRRTSGGPDLLSRSERTPQAMPQPFPTPPFAPKGADMALANLHLNVAKLQTAGPQLAVSLRKLFQGKSSDVRADLHRLLEALPVRGCKGSFGGHCFGANPAVDEQEHASRLDTLLDVVPCIEEGLERLSILITLVERSQALKMRGDAALQKSKGKGVDDDEEFIKNDDGAGNAEVVAEDSHDLIEAAAIAEAPKPSASRAKRPESARRRGNESPGGSSSRQQDSDGNPSPQPRDAIPSAEPSDKKQKDTLKGKTGQAPSATKGKKKKG